MVTCFKKLFFSQLLHCACLHTHKPPIELDCNGKMIWSIDNLDRNSSHKYIQISFTFLVFFILYIWVFIHLMNYCLYLGDPTIPMEFIQLPHTKMCIRGRMQIHPSTSNLTFPFGIYGLLLLLLVATKIQIQIPPTFDMFFRRYQ